MVSTTTEHNREMIMTLHSDRIFSGKSFENVLFLLTDTQRDIKLVKTLRSVIH